MDAHVAVVADRRGERHVLVEVGDGVVVAVREHRALVDREFVALRREVDGRSLAEVQSDHVGDARTVRRVRARCSRDDVEGHCTVSGVDGEVAGHPDGPTVVGDVGRRVRARRRQGRLLCDGEARGQRLPERPPGLRSVLARVHHAQGHPRGVADDRRTGELLTERRGRVDDGHTVDRAVVAARGRLLVPETPPQVGAGEEHASARDVLAAPEGLPTRRVRLRTGVVARVERPARHRTLDVSVEEDEVQQRVCVPDTGTSCRADTERHVAARAAEGERVLGLDLHRVRRQVPVGGPRADHVVRRPRLAGDLAEHVRERPEFVVGRTGRDGRAGRTRDDAVALCRIDPCGISGVGLPVRSRVPVEHDRRGTRVVLEVLDVQGRGILGGGRPDRIGGRCAVPGGGRRGRGRHGQGRHQDRQEHGYDRGTEGAGESHHHSIVEGQIGISDASIPKTESGQDKATVNPGCMST